MEQTQVNFDKSNQNARILRLHLHFEARTTETGICGKLHQDCLGPNVAEESKVAIRFFVGFRCFSDKHKSYSVDSFSATSYLKQL